MNDSDKNPQKPTFLQIVISTVAAAFGVQSSKNRERDFKHGNIMTYIVAGLVFTTLFVLTVALVVKSILQNSGL